MNKYLYIGIFNICLSICLMAYYCLNDSIYNRNIESILSYYEINEHIMVNDMYIDGILHIPSISLKLPIFDQCNKQTLNQGCCIYYKDSQQLIICAHNTSSMFKNIRKLKKGDQIYFDHQCYEVKTHEIIHENDINHMMNTSYDLTLFTCTYDSYRRYTIRCMKTSE